MTRSELARQLGVSRVTIWNYERLGLIPPAERISGNRSIFDAAAIRMARSLVEAAR